MVLANPPNSKQIEQFSKWRRGVRIVPTGSALEQAKSSVRLNLFWKPTSLHGIPPAFTKPGKFGNAISNRCCRRVWNNDSQL